MTDDTKKSHTFDNSLYEASYQALIENGVPVSTAQKASEVVASDNAALINFGRSASDQKNVDDAMTWYWAKQTETGGKR